MFLVLAFSVIRINCSLYTKKVCKISNNKKKTKTRTKRERKKETNQTEFPHKFMQNIPQLKI